MPKLKISKTITERFKISKRGKVLHRSGGRKHWRYKERAGMPSRGRKLRSLSAPDRRKFRKVLGI